MHLNVDEIEVLYLVCCVLLDSHKTLCKNDESKKGLSKRFLKFLRQYETNMFVNARNNNLDCVFVAFRKIIQGDFKTALEALTDVTYLEELFEKPILI